MKQSLTSNLCAVVLALALGACGSTDTNDGGSTSSGSGSSTTSSSSSSGTSGSQSCFQQSQTCQQTSDCCGSLTCDPTSLVCVSASSTTTGGTMVSCTPVASGGSCVSSYDCTSGELCLQSSGSTGLTCQTPPSVVSTCVDNFPPGPGRICCGEIVDAGGSLNCAPNLAPACAPVGAACGDAAACCNGSSCGASGTCVASCGVQGAPCASQTDCCVENGLSCVDSLFLGGSASGGNLCEPVGLAAERDAGGSYYCYPGQLCPALGSYPSTFIECQLGAECDGSTDAGDPCAADGLVCGPAGASTCANPGNEETCIQGGPACQPIAGTNAQTVCAQATFTTGTISLCVQPCAGATGSGECAVPYELCTQISATGYGCLNNLGTADAGPGSGCSALLAPCTNLATGDSLCIPLNDQFIPGAGLCTQAAVGDGGEGQACDTGANRQSGGFCDPSHYCAGGLCEAVCNAGTAGPSGCGSGLTCLPTLFPSGKPTNTDALDLGVCVSSTPCDVTATTGTACPTTALGVASKCYPAAVFGYPDSTPAFCGQAAAAPLPVGSVCVSGSVTPSGPADPCVAGALCLGVSGGTSYCRQLCQGSEFTKQGSAGGCQNATDTCSAVNLSGTPSTQVGACFPAASATTTTSGTGSTGGGSTSGDSGTSGGGSTGGSDSGGSTGTIPTTGTSGGDSSGSTGGSASTGGSTTA